MNLFCEMWIEDIIVSGFIARMGGGVNNKYHIKTLLISVCSVQTKWDYESTGKL